MDKESVIYKKVKKEADKIFTSKTGIYKSSWIVREYKKRGGIFLDKEPNNKIGLKRWYRENWVRVDKDGKPLKDKNGKIQKCGRKSEEDGKKSLCRPMKKVTKDTPKTIKELGSKELKRRYKLKSKNPHKTII